MNARELHTRPDQLERLPRTGGGRLPLAVTLPLTLLLSLRLWGAIWLTVASLLSL